MTEYPRTPERTNATGLGRDIELLELLASDDAAHAGGYGVADLTKRTGRGKSTISRALASLAEAGLAARDPETARYTIGPRIFALAARTTEAHLVRSAQPVLRGLVRATQETAHLCVLTHGNVLTLSSENSPHEMRSAAWEGVVTAAWRTPSGRVLISEWDRESVSAWYEQHGADQSVIDHDRINRESNPFFLLDTPPTSHARVTDFPSLLKELTVIKRNGYAIIDEEFETGVVGVSAPVYDHNGRLIAAVNVSGPTLRLHEKLDPLAAIVCKAGKDISQMLGASRSIG